MEVLGSAWYMVGSAWCMVCIIIQLHCQSTEHSTAAIQLFIDLSNSSKYITVQYCHSAVIYTH